MATDASNVGRGRGPNKIVTLEGGPLHGQQMWVPENFLLLQVSTSEEIAEGVTSIITKTATYRPSTDPRIADFERFESMDPADD